MRHNKRLAWRRDTALYAAIAFFAGVGIYEHDFPRWAVVFAGLMVLTLTAVKAKLSNGHPDKPESEPEK